MNKHLRDAIVLTIGIAIGSGGTIVALKIIEKEKKKRTNVSEELTTEQVKEQIYNHKPRTQQEICEELARMNYEKPDLEYLYPDNNEDEQLFDNILAEDHGGLFDERREEDE